MLRLGHFSSSSVRVNTWSLTTHTSVIRCVNHTLDMKWIHDALWLMIAGFKSQSWVWCLYFWCPVCHLLFIFGFSPALGLGSRWMSSDFMLAWVTACLSVLWTTELCFSLEHLLSKYCYFCSLSGLCEGAIMVACERAFSLPSEGPVLGDIWEEGGTVRPANRVNCKWRYFFFQLYEMTSKPWTFKARWYDCVLKFPHRKRTI